MIDSPSNTSGGDRFGAYMGRPPKEGEPTSRLYLRRIPIDSGGYDPGGAYWGLGAPLYEAFDDSGGFYWTERGTRESVKASILADYPGALFWR